MTSVLSNGCTVQVESIINTTISIEENSSIIVSVPCNPTTGYQAFVSIQDQAVVSNPEHHYESAPNPQGLCGSGGRTLFTLTGLKPGTSSLFFGQKRSWEQGGGVDHMPLGVVVVEAAALSSHGPSSTLSSSSLSTPVCGGYTTAKAPTADVISLVNGVRSQLQGQELFTKFDVSLI